MITEIKEFHICIYIHNFTDINRKSEKFVNIIHFFSANQLIYSQFFRCYASKNCIDENLIKSRLCRILEI